MQKQFQISLFLFRRDLRLEDNTGLIFALKHSKQVIPAFIFTPEQIEKNPFKSDHCLQFMIESLQDLEEQLNKKGGKLYLFQGTPDQILKECLSHLPIEAVIVNQDYTPYSQQRDKKIATLCKENQIAFHSFEDALLHPVEKILKKDGSPYSIFTPYFRQALQQKVSPPVSNRATHYFTGPIPFAKNDSLLSHILPKKQKQLQLKGGREEALKILKKLHQFSKYETQRDFLEDEYSTHLSPYLKFTVCSPREVYASICTHLDAHHDLIRSLHWRDFFTTIAFFFPHVFKGSFHPKWDQIEWSSDQAAFQRWCEGTTGFPLVDAGMRHMNQTGFMPNRVRMVTACFLVKDLLINWRWGEKYFAQTLIDYDPAVNNGNWQWIASTGADAQPYFRIFNPWNQQKKFDPDCVYIKKWVPELREAPPSLIHHWYDASPHQHGLAYPLPMLDHNIAARCTLAAYQDIK